MRQVWKMKEQEMIRNSKRRLFFVTDDLTIGVVPQKTTSTDEIWVILRCPALMVLRPKGKQYEVVGPMNLDSKIVSEVHKELEEQEKEGAHHGAHKVQVISLV
jgi:hypothetical protein